MSLVFRNIDVSPADPVEVWPTEAVLTALERGGLGLAAAGRSDPRGPVGTGRPAGGRGAGGVRPYGIGVLMADLVTAARQQAEHAERTTVAAEITWLPAAAGLSRAEFASAIGTSVSRLST